MSRRFKISKRRAIISDGSSSENEESTSSETQVENTQIKRLLDPDSKLNERLTDDIQKEDHKETVKNMVVRVDGPADKRQRNYALDEGDLEERSLQCSKNQMQKYILAMIMEAADDRLLMNRLQDLHSALESRPPESHLANPPRLLRSTLMRHQLHALAWLKWREQQQPAAGILADDMGLGKTITMIALILSDRDNMDIVSDEERCGMKNKKIYSGGTLVVCPASLIKQWADEVAKHGDPQALSVLVHHGSVRTPYAHRLSVYDLVITTYNILQRDYQKTGVLMRLKWRRVILDEAHIIRNHKSITSQAVCELQASRRWCLSGTPIQNKNLDLYPLLKFLQLTPFDQLPMWKKWIENKTFEGQIRLSTIISCVLLRRTKAQLQRNGQLDGLPQRKMHQIEITLTTEEMTVYRKVLMLSTTLFRRFLYQLKEKEEDADLSLGDAKSGDFEQKHKLFVALHLPYAKLVKSHEILVLLLRLRQICCHCGLVSGMLDGEHEDKPEDLGILDIFSAFKSLSIDDESDSDKEEEQSKEKFCVNEAIRSVISPNNPVFQLTTPSSKIRAVVECLRKHVFFNKGDKAVVVSQWTSVLRLVKQELEKDNIKSATLSGQVPVPARQTMINALNDPDDQLRVMLVSLCAGGVGLNLCGANHLLLLDWHWNPQLEEQAKDRIYRVGQKKTVHIYRFVCLDTVEESIQQMQSRKLMLAENILTGTKGNVSRLSIEDLKILFKMD